MNQPNIIGSPEYACRPRHWRFLILYSTIATLFVSIQSASLCNSFDWTCTKTDRVVGNCLSVKFLFHHSLRLIAKDQSYCYLSRQNMKGRFLYCITRFCDSLRSVRQTTNNNYSTCRPSPTYQCDCTAYSITDRQHKIRHNDIRLVRKFFFTSSQKVAYQPKTLFDWMQAFVLWFFL